MTSIFKRLFVSEEKKVLGRWSIEHCNKKLNNKIDLSNEDHCGPCGQYALDKMCNTIIYNNNNKSIAQGFMESSGPSKPAIFGRDEVSYEIGTKAITKFHGRTTTRGVL